jgi:hypothetical protein
MSLVRFTFETEGSLVHRDKLIPHPENANNGDIDEIKNSILRNGCYRRVIASMRTRHILGGNNLYAALVELEAEYIPVEWNDVDAATERRILAGDNAIARQAWMDRGLEVALLDRIKEDDPDVGLVGTGYTEKRHADLLAALEPDKPLDLSGIEAAERKGLEGLVHTITCPECGHSWTRGKD